MNLTEMKDQEDIKTEIYALSSIREALHKDSNHAEVTVITKVQKRLQDLVNEAQSEKETTSSLRNMTVNVNFESLGTGIDKFKAEINKYLYEAAGVAFPAIKKDEELTGMVKEMSKTGALTLGPQDEVDLLTAVRYEKTVSIGEQYVTETIEGSADDVLKVIIESKDKDENTNMSTIGESSPVDLIRSYLECYEIGLLSPSLVKQQCFMEISKLS